MVFVFGIDVPLIELIFLLTIVLILLFILLVYVVITQININKRLRTITVKESRELKVMGDIQKKEQREVELLQHIRSELDKLIYGESILRGTGRKKTKTSKTAEQRKIKDVADSFWQELVRISEKKYKKKIIQKLRSRK